MKIYKSYSIKNIINILIFIISLLVLLIFSKDHFESVKSSITIFISNIIPSLFPFIFFTEFILNTDILATIQTCTGKFFSKVFSISKNASPAIITGFLCGFPMGAKTAIKLYEDGNITKKEAANLLIYINNCNPAFILSTIGIGILYNIKLGIVLLLSHYLASTIIGILFCKMHPSNIIHKKEVNLNSFTKNNQISNQNLFEIIKNCIKNTFFTLSMILGFMIIFNLLFNLLSKILILFNIDNNAISILSGFFEITNGINQVFLSTINLDVKILIISFLLGFSGLCIICQIYSTISKYKFSLKKLILAKFIHGIFSMAITYILINYTNVLDFNTISVYSNIEENTKEYYIYNIKKAYLISTSLISIFLFIYYFIRRKVAHKNIGYKKEGG